MPLFRVYRIIGYNLWEIMEVPRESKEVKYRQDELFYIDIKLSGEGPLAAQAIWTDKPTPLAAFSQALMLFNGEQDAV
jgi:hypothetical protein